VIHFIDNTGACSALVHGYASKPDCARLVNAYHAQAVGLRCMAGGEWVRSKANPADIPTRESRHGEMPETAKRVVMKLPPVDRGDRGRCRRMDPEGARPGGRGHLDR
jgi:hypothetical protein